MALAPKNGAIRSAVPSTMAASTTWPCAGPLGVEQAGDQAEGEQHPAATEVGDQVERWRRELAGPTDVGERASHGRVGEVMARAVGQRALLAPSGHPAVDEPRVAGRGSGGPDAEPLGHPGPEALEEGVGSLDEPEHDLRAPGGLEVDGHGPRPAAEDVEAGAPAAAADRGRPGRSG